MKNIAIYRATCAVSYQIKIGLLVFAVMFLNVTSAIAKMQSISAEDAGISSHLSHDLKRAHDQGELKNLHGILVLRHGKIAIEQYFPGHDEIWGTPAGRVEFDAETLHDLRSITKSIVSLVYGIALEQNLVPPVDQPLLQSYPEYRDLGHDPARNGIRVVHALNMTMGLDWNEDLPYSDPQNSEIAMERASDRYHYILSRDVLHEPGTQWEYSGGATALIGNLITRGANEDIFAFATRYLFGPMGITDLQWTAGTNGTPSVASGLRMTPRDLAKIGQLILNQGLLGNQRLVPESWLEQSFMPQADTGDGIQYGYQWWLGNMKKDGSKWISAFGNGGQRLIVIPALGLVVVITAGNYNHPDQWRLPVKVMSEFIIPAIVN